MNPRPKLLPLVLTIVLIFARCGTNSDNTFTSSLPNIAITSPTAGTSSTTAALVRPKNRDLTLTVKAAIASVLAPLLRQFGLQWELETRAEDAKTPEVKPMNQMMNDLTEIADKSMTDAAASVSFRLTNPTNSCYGQGKAYTNHPDGGANASTLSGDTGFDSETQTTDGVVVACPAATMNAKVAQLTGLVNEALKLMYVGSVALTQAGKEVPATTSSPAVSATLSGVPGLTSATVELTKKDDLDGGYKTVEWSITGTMDGNAGEGPIEFTLTHSELSRTDYKGKFTGSLPQGNDWYAFSLVYTQSGDSASYVLKSLKTRSVTSTTAPTNLFGTDGTVTLSPTGSGTDRQDMFVTIANINTSNGLGDMRSAWNAGKTDPRSRVFQGHTESGTGGADTGYAYFGFGDPLTDANFSAGTIGTIRGMICAWTAGNNNFIATSTGQITRAQGMKMLRNTTSGQFEPSSTDADVKIAYCPTDDCNGGAGMTYGGTACTGTHDLATIDEYGAVTVTIPTYP